MLLLLIVNPHAAPVEIGFTINPFSVTDSVTEVDVLAIIAKLSTDFSIFG